MIKGMFMGILLIMTLSMGFNLFLFDKRKLVFPILVWPGYLSEAGSWIFSTLATIVYLVKATPNYYGFWIAVFLFPAICCFLKALIDEIFPDMDVILYSCGIFFPALLATCIFMLFPFLFVRLVLTTVVLILFIIYLYGENGGSLKNILRLIINAPLLHLFPLPLLVFFLITCFI